MNFIKSLVKKLFPRKLLKIVYGKYYGIKRRKAERLYRGSNVLCPCCGKRFDRFMDYGYKKYNYREFDYYKNTICPYCFSYPRHRIVCYYFSKVKETVPHDNILIFGAEPSIINWFDMNDCHYTTADLFNRAADVKIDIQNILFPDESWKLIICNHVLEHVPDYKTALKELRRILKKDGFLELTVPIDRNLETVYEDPNITRKEDRIKHFGQYDHVRIFGNDFEKIVTEAGFSVETINGDKLPNEIVGIIGPANYDDNRIYICRRK